MPLMCAVSSAYVVITHTTIIVLSVLHRLSSRFQLTVKYLRKHK